MRGAERRIGERAHQCRARCEDEIAQVAQSFAEMGDAYLAARVDDIRVVGARLMRNLTKTPYAAYLRVCPKARSSSPKS